MSILDFTTGLFRDPATLRSFIDDPDQALANAGLPDATPEQIRDLLPVVAESMPPDHPLQAVVHAADPARALAELDVDEVVFQMHHHHHKIGLIEKALGIEQCRPETVHGDHWQLVEEADKALGDPVALQIAADIPEPDDGYADDYPDDPPPADPPNDDHAIAEGFVDTF